MPHHAFVRRSFPFRRVDEEEIDAACRRIAGNTEYLIWAGWKDDRERDCRVIGFETPERAKAMQEWIDENRIADRPYPKIGQSKEEFAALREASLRWGFSTGAMRRVVQAYRRKMRESGEGPQAEYQAAHTVMLYRPPGDEPMIVGMFLVAWAKENHPDWFYGRRKPISESPKQNE